ncbi:zinc-binding dehydrogenase [Mycobacterium sp. ITM-2016-00317]|uniref:zinc-binding dehydrogenase n=1 Tax=Mycobacterium sp. ITM-2016-00317 TaxID=2099694 RepID=UPI00287F8043|nr:zinc-binding dehydrogenase [Mycobacterium sp. ITM-2016-00317]WNG87430.1 zinc-binding dehydrogenase [Mycobacterium sp. ITM-2016-00317]
MRAAVLTAYNSPLRVRELPDPVPGPGEVLVRVMAGGVNPLDIKIRRGEAAHAQMAPPAVLGIDMAGVVEAIGAGVDRFRVGDEVFGMTGGGAGGVGFLAVQLAIARGARVYATGSASSQEIIGSTGATPIDYTARTVDDYVGAHTGDEGFDIVVDNVGGATLDASFTAVKRYTGHVVSALGWGTHSLAPLSFRGATYSGVFTLMPLLSGRDREHHGHIVAQAAALADSGRLVPRLHPSTFPLDAVNDAHAIRRNRSATGKVVVTPGA